GRYSASSESFGGNRQNSRAGSEVKGTEVGGKDAGIVGEKSQARRRRGMLTGTKCHPSRNENAAHLRTALVPGAPSLYIRKDFELSANRQRAARACWIVGPDALLKLRGASAKASDEFSRLACMTIRLDLEGTGVRPAKTG